MCPILDCYESISPNFKTELYESSIKIRAANGSFIKNRGECDLTFKINDEQFTFPFLCSDQLSQQLILGHNLPKHSILALLGMLMIQCP